VRSFQAHPARRTTISCLPPPPRFRMGSSCGAIPLPLRSTCGRSRDVHLQEGSGD
jgi:hypothetical protein